jgi:hypothetical protein
VSAIPIPPLLENKFGLFSERVEIQSISIRIKQMKDLQILPAVDAPSELFEYQNPMHQITLLKFSTARYPT